MAFERVRDLGDDPCGVEAIDVAGTPLADGPLRALGWGTLPSDGVEKFYTGILWKRDAGEGPLFLLSPDDGTIPAEGYLYHDARAVMGGYFCFGCDVAGFVRGDVDGNGTVHALLDALYLLEWTFAGGNVPPCSDAADVDDNGVVSALLDSLRLLHWTFTGQQPPPPEPYPQCGLDPTYDVLDCVTPPLACE